MFPQTTPFSGKSGIERIKSTCTTGRSIHPEMQTHQKLTHKRIQRYNTNMIYEGPMLPRRVCCAWQGAMPVQHARVPEQAQESTPPDKN